MHKTNIVLLDIPSRLAGRTAVSPWTKRVRFVLEYKQLAFTTEWVEFGDIESTCRKYGILPTTSRPVGTPRFTLPAIIDKTKDADHPIKISDSLPIIQYLDSTYPDPHRPLFPSITPADLSEDARGIPRSQKAIADYIASNIYPAIRGLVIINVYNLQTDTGRDPWLSSLRAGYHFSSIEELSPGPLGSKQREDAWVSAEKSFDNLEQPSSIVSDSGSSGVWLLGHTRPTYADFVLLSFLSLLKVASPDEGWERVKIWSGGRWRMYMDAFEQLVICA